MDEPSRMGTNPSKKADLLDSVQWLRKALTPRGSKAGSLKHEPYQYRPFRDAERQIRLVTLLPGRRKSDIHITVDVVPFDEDQELRKYEALSYTWGSQDDPALIHIEEQQHRSCTLSVTRNLHVALNHLRYRHESRVLWIDAICINQRDDVEKSFQVALMAQVYPRAASVTAWIGPESSDSELAFSVLEEISSQVDYDDDTSALIPLTQDDHGWSDLTKPMPLRQSGILAVQRLLGRPWFRRLWIWQEVLLSPSRTSLRCADRALAWLKFVQAFRCLSLKRIDMSANGIKELLDRRELLGKILTVQPRSILTFLDFARSCECSDSRDKIYGVLGLGRSQIVPDYSASVQRVYKDFVQQWCESSKDLRVLCYITERQRISNLPSFVPDWSAESPYARQNLGIYAGAGTGGLKFTIQDDMLRVTGVAVCHVDCTVPYIGSKDTYHTIEMSKNLNDFLSNLAGQITTPLSDEYLDNLCDILHGGCLRETNPSRQYLPTKHDGKTVISKMLSGQADTLSHSVKADVARWCHLFACGRSMFVSPEGKIGLGPSTIEPGDAVAVLAGCDAALVLRRRNDDTYRVIGPAYCGGVMQGQMILGPLPGGYTFIVQVPGAATSGRGRVRGFMNQRTRVIEMEDPRLPPMPRGWQQMQSETMESAALFRNSNTGEERHGYQDDPRLDLDFLKSRVPFRDFVLI